MKIILALAVLMLGAVGCDSEKPSAITGDEAKLKAAKARYYEREEGDKKELERIHQSPEYRAWLAEGEAMKRRREEEREAKYSIRGNQMRKNGIPCAVRSPSGRWLPLVGRD